MDKLIIEGGIPLCGEVEISGSKNALLPILAASLLTDEECVIENVPNLCDVETMLKIIGQLGPRVEYKEGRIKIEGRGYKDYCASYELVRTMRASICLLGALAAKLGRARISLPGGCVIGPRPIDLHLKGLAALGFHIDIENGYINVKRGRVEGCYIYLGGIYGSSVLATANVLMAACLVPGQTIIDQAACEPEIVDLAKFLIKMGARIEGYGSHCIKVEGVKRLKGARHKIIPDRIEAGTYLIAGLITGGWVRLKNVLFRHIGALLDKLREYGAKIIVDEEQGILEVHRAKRSSPVNIVTLPYPGFPTDMQAQMIALLCITPGISVLTERVYPERFMHIGELVRMGADISLEGPSAIIRGVERFSPAPVMASDLRASASLVLAGLCAKGTTTVARIYHLDRGYERMEEKLSKLGARIKRV